MGAEPCRAGGAGQGQIWRGGRWGSPGDGGGVAPAAAARLLQPRTQGPGFCRAAGCEPEPAAIPYPGPAGGVGRERAKCFPLKSGRPAPLAPPAPPEPALAPGTAVPVPRGASGGGTRLAPGERRARLCRAPNGGHGAERRAGGRSGSDSGDCHPKRAGRPGAGQRGRRLARGRAEARAAAAWEARAGRGAGSRPRGGRAGSGAAVPGRARRRAGAERRGPASGRRSVAL